MREKRVYHWHLRACGYCNRGLRPWFAGRGISWADFLADGVDASFLVATGDAMAIKAVDFAESTGWAKEPQTADTDRKGCV